MPVNVDEFLTLIGQLGTFQRRMLLKLSANVTITAFVFFLDCFSGALFPCVPPPPPHGHEASGGNRSAGRELVAFGGGEGRRNACEPRAAASVEASLAVNASRVELGLTAGCCGGASEAYSLQDFKFYSQTMFMVGLLVGSIAMGIASDRYGRRPVLLSCVASQGAAEFVVAFLPNFPTYLLGRLLTGTTASGIMLCSFSLGVEWCGPALRAWPPIILALAFSVGMMALAGVAKISQNWPQLHLATGVPQLMVLLLFWSLPESPRWLFFKKRTTEARNLLRQASIINRRTEEKVLHALELVDVEETFTNRRAANESTLLTTFRNRTLRKRLLIMSYICAAVSMTYYGLCLSVGDFGLDIHMAQFLSGLAEVPQLLLPPLMRRVGRRSLCIVCLSVAGATCLLCLPLQRNPELANVVVALALLGKLCAQVTACVATLYRIELFPTNVRQNALGAVAMCGSVGSLLAPLVNRAALVLGVSALSVHGCLPLAGAALALLLPETRRAPFPDSVEECERQPSLALPCAVGLFRAGDFKKTSQAATDGADEKEEEEEDATASLRGHGGVVRMESVPARGGGCSSSSATVSIEEDQSCSKENIT
ncbi:unnamed protein product [Lampetra fluviatilis]